MSNEKGELSRTFSESIEEITFSHPKGNSLPRILLYSLADAIREAGSDSEVKVVVLRSAGDSTFCAGASFDELLAIDSLEKAQGFFSGFAKVILAIKQCPKFIIARVQGKVVGGGAGLVAACDYAFALESSSVRLSELAIGIGPFTIGPAVQRKIGLPAFNEMAISADWRSAKWCCDRGLFAEVVPTIEALDERVLEFSRRLSGYSLEAMISLKRALWEGTENWESVLADRVATTGRLVLSRNAQEALHAAKNKK